MADASTGWITLATTAVGAICGAVLGVLGIGKKIERYESGLARSHERLDGHDKKFESHEQALKTVVAIFTRDDGEPRFVTGIVCGEHARSCHESLEAEFKRGVDNFARIERDILAIKTSQDSNLQTILVEIRGIKQK